MVYTQVLVTSESDVVKLDLSVKICLWWRYHSFCQNTSLTLENFNINLVGNSSITYKEKRVCHQWRKILRCKIDCRHLQSHFNTWCWHFYHDIWYIFCWKSISHILRKQYGKNERRYCIAELRVLICNHIWTCENVNQDGLYMPHFLSLWYLTILILIWYVPSPTLFHVMSFI